MLFFGFIGSKLVVKDDVVRLIHTESGTQALLGKTQFGLFGRFNNSNILMVQLFKAGSKACANQRLGIVSHVEARRKGSESVSFRVDAASTVGSYFMG